LASVLILCNACIAILINFDGSLASLAISFSLAALELSRYCKSRVVLTGTPAPNGYEDLNNLFRFIWPTKEVVGFNPYQLKEMSDSPTDNRIDTLISNISPYFMRIKKSDLGLPPQVNHEPIVVQMGTYQKEIYNFIEEKYIGYLISQNNTQSAGFHSVMARARLIRLMQASTNPALLSHSLEVYFSDQGYPQELFINEHEILRKILNYQDAEIPPKFVKASQLITELIAKGKKVVVWAVFIDNLISLQKYLMSQGITSKLLYSTNYIVH